MTLALKCRSFIFAQPCSLGFTLHIRYGIKKSDIRVWPLLKTFGDFGYNLILEDNLNLETMLDNVLNYFYKFNFFGSIQTKRNITHIHDFFLSIMLNACKVHEVRG